MAKNSNASLQHVLLDHLKVDVHLPIKVMICRKWDVNNVQGRYLSTDFIVSDEKGNVMHVTTKNNISHRFINKLHEGSIYFIRNFSLEPNKEEYRIMKNATHMLELHGSTLVTKVTSDSNGFVRYPFQFVELESLEPTNNKYFVDVVGYVTSVGKSMQQRTGSKTLDFILTNQRGHKIKVTLWGKLGDTLLEKNSQKRKSYAIVLTSMSAKYYNNNLCLSSSSSTLIIEDEEIPVLKEFKTGISDVTVLEEDSRAMQIEARDGTMEQLLKWARNNKKDSVTFRCKLEITNVRTRNGWYYIACTSGKCKKGVTRQDGEFWCHSCKMTISYPMPRFKLEIDVKDDSPHGAVSLTMWDETAEMLTGTTAKVLFDKTCEGDDDDTVLPTKLKNLINTTHIFEIKSHTYYEHPTFENFTCTAIVQSHITSIKVSPNAQLGELENTLPTNISDVVTEVQASPLKRLKRGPMIATPLKATEPKKRKFCIEDDSDLEENGVGGGSGSKDNEKEEFDG